MKCCLQQRNSADGIFQSIVEIIYGIEILVMAPRKKDPKLLVQRAVITTDPNKAISEYFQSKLDELGVRKYPEWDRARNGPEAELIIAQRDLLQAEEELEAKLNVYDDKQKEMDDQWDEMAKKMELLQNSFIEFNTFVLENSEKRERTEGKIREEKERQEKCEEEIKMIKNQLEYMSEVRDKMQKYVKDYKNAQNYLESVVNETGEFQSIGDIFNKYESLIEARETVTENQDQSLQALEETGTEMQRMTEEKGHKLMSLNNQLATLQSRYGRAKAEALKWEGIVSRIKSIAAEKNLELTQIKSCSWNIYQQMCKRKCIPIQVDKEDLENQLVHIKRTILELKRITKVAKSRAAREEKLAKFRHIKTF